MGHVVPHVVRSRSRIAPGTHEVHALYEVEYTSLVRTVCLIVRDRAAAEDIAQDTFVQLLRHWSKVSRYDEPGAWLRRVAIREAVRAARRARLRVVREREAMTPSGVSTSPSEGPMDPALMAALQELSPRQRAVVVLFYLEDRPMDEVVDLLGCSTSTGWVHLHRARRQLAARLGEEVCDDVD